MLTPQEIVEITLSSLNGLTNVAIGGYLLLYGYWLVPLSKRKQSTLWFVAISVVAGIWSLSVSSLYLPRTTMYDPILSYLSAGTLPLLFLGFVRHLIYGNVVDWDIRWKALYIWGFMVLAYISIPGIGMIDYSTGEAVIRLNELPHHIYSVYLVFFFVMGIALLFREIIRNSRRKKEFQSVLLITGFAILWGIIFNLILPIVTQEDIFFRIGPLGLLLMNAMMAWLISKYRIFVVTSTSLKFFVLFLIVIISLYVEIARYRFGVETQINSTRILMFASVLGVTFLIFRQMIESIRYTDNLKLAQKNLEASVEEKNIFLQISSHQLRTPVTVLSGYVEKIYDDLEQYHAGKRVRSIFDKLLIQVTSLSDIVSDVLSVNSLRSGSFDVGRKELIDANQFLQEILQQKEFLIQTLKVSVEFVPLEHSVQILADKIKLSQAVINVFENALRYGKGKVRIVMDQVDKESIRITILDNGLGISKEQQKWIFEKFTRSEDAQKKRPDGSGVGLYLAKLIVERHSGTIEVQSEGKGLGSQFIITLPVAD